MTHRLVVLVVLLAVTVPAAAHDPDRPRRPDAVLHQDESFVGWSAGAADDVRRAEPFGYISEDADVWAIVTGGGIPVRHCPVGRLAIRLGTEIVPHGPAVEPGRAGFSSAGDSAE